MVKKAAGVKLPLWKKFIFAVVVVAPALLIMELLMRLCGYGPAENLTMSLGTVVEEHQPDPFEYFTICDRQLGFRNRPHGSYRSWYIRGNPLSTTDKFGYRNGFGWSAAGESPIVLFVGDSTTFCSEVNDDETGPSEVAKLLGKEFEVRVLNAGVRGYGTLQARRMLVECLERFPCIKVAVYTYCSNDFEENVVPDLRFPAKAPRIVHNAETGEFREVEVSDPVVAWGEDFLDWEPDRPPPSTMAKVTKWFDDRSALWHQCLVGLGRLVGEPAATDHEKWNAWAIENGGQETLEWLLGEMDRICRSHGAVLVATSFYNGLDIRAPREFADTCAAEGVRFVHLEDHFTGKFSSCAARRVDGRFDEHYGTLGTKTYAAALAPALKRILRSRTSPCRKGAQY